MINCKHINIYNKKISYINFKYSTDTGFYTSTHDVKVLFHMPYFYRSTMIMYFLNKDNSQGDERIGYDMIMVGDVVVP